MTENIYRLLSREEFDDICFNEKFLSNEANQDIEIEEVDYSGKIMVPGFIDVHTHGGNNYDFTTVKSVDEIKEVLKFYHSHGVTALLPTLLTEHDEVIFRQEALISEASKSEPSIIGIHLEGPFVSKEYKGAQLEECLQNPSIEKCKEFIEHSNGLFKYMTIAPELPGSVETIKFLHFFSKFCFEIIINLSNSLLRNLLNNELLKLNSLSKHIIEVSLEISVIFITSS